MARRRRDSSVGGSDCLGSMAVVTWKACWGDVDAYLKVLLVVVVLVLDEAS